MVEDAYQGRGIGSVLLEHLAEAARRAGITRFVAEVLPAEPAHAAGLRDAGFQVSRAYADGVVHLTFPIAPTPRRWRCSAAGNATPRRRRSPGCCSPRRWLSTACAATAPARRDAVAPRRRGGFTGRGLADPPERVHSGGTARLRRRAPTPGAGRPGAGGRAGGRVPAAVADAGRGRARTPRWCISAGFAEIGAAGARGAGAWSRCARSHGMRLVGPELPRHRQHRPGGAPQRHPGAGAGAARPGRGVLPVGRVRASRSWRSRRARPRRPPSSRPATGPTSPATTCCSTGATTRAPTWCCSTWRHSATRTSSPASRGSWPGTSRSSRSRRAPRCGRQLRRQEPARSRPGAAPRTPGPAGSPGTPGSRPTRRRSRRWSPTVD